MCFLLRKDIKSLCYFPGTYAILNVVRQSRTLFEDNMRCVICWWKKYGDLHPEIPGMYSSPFGSTGIFTPNRAINAKRRMLEPAMAWYSPSTAQVSYVWITTIHQHKVGMCCFVYMNLVLLAAAIVVVLVLVLVVVLIWWVGSSTFDIFFSCSFLKQQEQIISSYDDFKCHLKWAVGISTITRQGGREVFGPLVGWHHFKLP